MKINFNSGIDPYKAILNMENPFLHEIAPYAHLIKYSKSMSDFEKNEHSICVGFDLSNYYLYLTSIIGKMPTVNGNLLLADLVIKMMPLHVNSVNFKPTRNTPGKLDEIALSFSNLLEYVKSNYK